MLGRDVVRAAQLSGHEVLAADRATLDVTDSSATRAFFGDEAPQAVIDCAAFTDVDGAEREPGEAMKVNADGARNLAAGLAAAASRIENKSRDLGRAFDRMSIELHRDLARWLRAEDRDLETHGVALRPAGERALARYRERIDNLGAVIEAKDFRRRGWVMATDRDCAAVTSAAGLHPGDGLRLRFADGDVDASVTNIDNRTERDEQRD